MKRYINHKNKNDLGKLIHVGAGIGNELNDYLAQPFTEVILLEPNPKVNKTLENKIAKLSQLQNTRHIKLLNTALSTNTGEQPFFITQPSRYSSFFNTDKLQSLFQNLKVEQELKVKTITLPELLQLTELQQEQHNTLILQVNGAEFPVLSQTNEASLMLFSTVIIQSSKLNYFEQANNSNDLIEIMASKGFELTTEVDSDAVFNNLVFSKDENTSLIKNLNEQLQQEQEKSKELENQLTSLSEESKKLAEAKANECNQLTEQNQAKASRITELESQLTTLSEESKQLAEAKANECKRLTEENQAKASRITELESQLTTGSEESKKLAEAKANECKQLTEQNQAKASRITELEQQLETASEESKQLAEAKANECKQLNEQNQENTSVITELEGTLKVVKEKLTSESSNIEQLKAEIIKLEQDKSVLTKEKDEQAHWHQENKKWAESLNSQIDKLSSDLNEKSRSVTLGQKMLAKSQIDLDSLRESYKEKVQSEKELVELIKVLREKLTLASNYYHQLQQEHPEILLSSNNVVGS